MDNTETGNNNNKYINNIILNKSKENFSEEKLALLNKGINYPLKEVRFIMQDIKVTTQYRIDEKESI